MAERRPQPYDVMKKRRTPSFDQITRDLIDRRVHAPPERQFFDPDEYALLQALCARLLPQPERARPIPIAPFIDADLFEGRGEGFRQPGDPPPQAAWRRGLAAIEGHARRRSGQGFIALDPAEQDAVLTSVQAGEADGETADGGLPPSRFFIHLLLKAAAGVYYSHPDAWSEIGFGGPASPRGYVRIGLDARDPWEAPFAPPRTP